MVLNGAKLVVTVVFLMFIANISAENPCAYVMSGFKNDYTSCSHYFSCVQGFAFRQQCPFGLIFNENNLKCEPEETVKCVPCPPNDTLMYRMKGSCRGYVRCNFGNAVQMQCDLGLWFDEVNLVCDRRELVNCFDDHDCPINGNHYIPAVGDLTCVNYQFCSNGQPKGTYSCARDLFFNVTLGRCVASRRCPQ